jgi:hypothetical protein
VDRLETMAAGEKFFSYSSTRDQFFDALRMTRRVPVS